MGAGLSVDHVLTIILIGCCLWSDRPVMGVFVLLERFAGAPILASSNTTVSLSLAGCREK
jgi:hypothetical protein